MSKYFPGWKKMTPRTPTNQNQGLQAATFDPGRKRSCCRGDRNGRPGGFPPALRIGRGIKSKGSGTDGGGGDDASRKADRTGAQGEGLVEWRRKGKGVAAVKTGSLKRAAEMQQEQQLRVVAESRGSSKAALCPLVCRVRTTDGPAGVLFSNGFRAP